ncbi:MAG: hypothetical protein EBY29_16660, partial [Planctomycetes bacterium]|nr:hypothetical protein [Planctomycetota bacterium]
QQYGPGMTKAFQSLGPEVSTISRKPPDGVEGMRTFTAIRCTDEKATNALLATILPSMGMMPRDFQGQVVYGGEGLGSEIGLGGGALVMGSVEAVEQSLRSAGDPSTKSLAENPLYRRCLGSLPSGSVVGWGYADVPTLLEQNRKAILAADGNLSDGDDDASDDGKSAPAAQDGSLGVLVPTQYDPAMKPALEKIDHAMLSRYFGPLVWDIRSETKGIRVHAHWMRAAAEVVK